MGLGVKRSAVVAGITVLSILTFGAQGNNNVKNHNSTNKNTVLRQSADQTLFSSRRALYKFGDNANVRNDRRSKLNDSKNEASHGILNRARTLIYKVLSQPRIVGGTPVEENEFPSFTFTVGETLCGTLVKWLYSVVCRRKALNPHVT
jgi:hypothetical protein